MKKPSNLLEETFKKVTNSEEVVACLLAGVDFETEYDYKTRAVRFFTKNKVHFQRDKAGNIIAVHELKT